MKTLIKKILGFDRVSTIITIATILVLIITIVMSIHANNIARKNNKLTAQLTELQTLNERLTVVKDIVELQEKKIGLTKTTGVVTTLEQILKSLGLNANVIRPLERKRKKEFVEEDAELEIKNINLNSIVNLLYKIDNSPVPMKIKSAVIKTTFEDPDRFILKLTASLISKA